MAATSNTNEIEITLTEPWALDKNGHAYSIGKNGYIPSLETSRYYDPDYAGSKWDSSRSGYFPMDSIKSYPKGTKFYSNDGGNTYYVKNLLESTQTDGLPAQKQNSKLEEGSKSGNGGETSGGNSDISSLDIVDLDGNILFNTEDPIKMEEDKEHKQSVVNPEFKAIIKAFKEESYKKACLRQSADWDANHLAPKLHYNPLRNLYANYGPGTEEFKKVDKKESNPENSNSINSWELPYLLLNIGAGLLIDIPETGDVNYTKFPVGTLFFYCHPAGNSYLEDSELRDENGKVYPSHTDILGGYSTDLDGVVSPLVMDYHHIVNTGTSPNLYGHNPTYAFIPNGRENYTAEKLMPLYKKYLEGIKSVDLNALKIKDNDRVNSEIDKIDPKVLYRISQKYNVPLNDTFRRLMAIGLQESELGSSWKYYGKSILGSTGDWATLTAKRISDDMNDIGHIEGGTPYDTKTSWEHEVEIYDKLKQSGAFNGKSQEEIRKLVADAYNKDKAASYNDYGVVATSPNYDVSRGWFQMKDDPYTDSIYDSLRSSSTKDEDKISRAYNRFAYLYDQIRRKYPNLTAEQLLNAATISWNAPSKIDNETFRNHYILNDDILDSYLSKILGYQSSMYKKGGGIHLNPKNKGKFTETKKRTGKTTEELTHSKNPLTRKRAIFALNAKKWKHLFGGTFKGLATDNGLMVSKDKTGSKMKPKIQLVKKHK